MDQLKIYYNFMMKKLLSQIFAITILFGGNGLLNAQTMQKCATDMVLDKFQKQHPKIYKTSKSRNEKFTGIYKKIQNNSSYKIKNTTITVPVVIHVIHNGEPVGTYPNMSDVQLVSGIEYLNHAFQNTDRFADTDFYNNPMNIEFVLAQVSPDGTASTGIERHDVSSKSYGADYNADGLKLSSAGADLELLFNDYYWSPQDYMNIWLVKEIDGVDTSTGQGGILGFATLPNGAVGAEDGLVCQARAFGFYENYNSSNPPAGFDFGRFSSSENGTAHHEVGHYLNLLHTFEGDQSGGACPSGVVEIGVNDDGCDDIPRHIRSFGCPSYSATGNSCTGGSNEYIHNFMDYTDDPCYQGFSADQKTRCEATLAGPRRAFITSIGAQAPTGTYPVSVSAIVNQPDYQLGITKVSLNGMEFESEASLFDGGYLNRVASQPTISLASETDYTLEITVGYAGDDNTYGELVNAYIDYNNNGVFETSELIYQTMPRQGKVNGDTFTTNFTTPSSSEFVADTRLRMRIISAFDDWQTPITSTTSTTYGQIEDYAVIIDETSLSTGSIDLNTSVNNATKFSLYPNPCDDLLTITGVNDAAKFAIYTTNGDLVLSGVVSSKEYTIDVKSLSSGLYFITFDSNKQTLKLVKN